MITQGGPFLTEEELLAGDDFFDGSNDSEDEERLLNETESTHEIVEDLGESLLLKSFSNIVKVHNH